MSEAARDALAAHPAVVAVTTVGRDRERAVAFAVDLAAYLVGEPLAQRSSLVRVVAAVATRELDDPRAVCRGRLAASVEASARATATLWPWLRGVDPPPEPPPEAEPPPEGKEAAEEPTDDASGDPDAGGDGEAGAGEDGAASDASGQPRGDDATGGGGGIAASGPGGGERDDRDGDTDRDAGDSDDGDGDSDEGDSNKDDSDDGDSDKGESDEAGDGEPEARAAGDDAAADPDGDDPGDPIAAPPLDPAVAARLTAAMQQAVGGALAVDRLERRLGSLLPGLGWSHATGALQQHLLRDLPRWAELLAHLPQLDALADQLGRVEGQSRRSGAADGGSEEVVGVHFAGDAARALPSELALLADDDTEDLFYARWAEHRLLSLELEGAGIDGTAMGEKRGPVIACLDTSGSMEGAPELAAKALLLAVVRRVVPRGRAVHALLFGGPDEITELRIDRGRGGLDAVLGFLAWRFHAGTDFDGPLQRAVELLDERDLQLADILVVTDGLGWASEAIVEAVNAARQARGVRVWSVLVGRGGPDGVAAFSDAVWHVDPRDAAAASGLLRRMS